MNPKTHWTANLVIISLALLAPSCRAKIVVKTGSAEKANRLDDGPNTTEQLQVSEVEGSASHDLNDHESVTGGQESHDHRGHTHANSGRAVMPTDAELMLMPIHEAAQLAMSEDMREIWQQPGKVIDSLEIEPGQRVADLGAGDGYFTFRLADVVQANGRVYACDVDPDKVAHLEDKARDEGKQNVIPVHCSAIDPKLPERSIDLVLTVMTFHHFEDPVAYFQALKKCLNPSGRVAVIELQSGIELVDKLIPNHARSVEDIVRVMKAAGYRLEQSFDFLRWQSFLIFSYTE